MGKLWGVCPAAVAVRSLHSNAAVSTMRLAPQIGQKLRGITSEEGIPGLLRRVKKAGYAGLPALALAPALGMLVSGTGSQADRTGA